MHPTAINRSAAPQNGGKAASHVEFPLHTESPSPSVHKTGKAMTYYLVDGSEDCFFTAVFDAFGDRDCVITSEKYLQLGLEYTLTEVQTDGQKCNRVKKKLDACDRLCLKDIALVLRSCDPLKEQTALEYIRLIVAKGGAVRNMLAEPAVMEMTETLDRVTGEIHKMKGFLRFIENSEGVLYAPYSPDNDITDLLAPHFARRFSNQRFVIHDVKRKKAALFDGNEIVMFDADGAEIYLSEYQQHFEDLWRQYYKSVNIESRPHEKQMKGYMPVRYWKFLPEKK